MKGNGVKSAIDNQASKSNLIQCPGGSNLQELVVPCYWILVISDKPQTPATTKTTVNLENEGNNWGPMHSFILGCNSYVCVCSPLLPHGYMIS